MYNRRLVRRFFSLSNMERTLLFEATALLTAIRLALGVVPFASVRRILSRLAASRSLDRSSGGQPDDAARSRAIWAVETISRHFPAVGTCLTQALAAHVLIGRTGCKSDLRIGVTRHGDGKFVAHAWLEKDGIVLIGGACHASYTPMPVLDGLDPRISHPTLRS